MRSTILLCGGTGDLGGRIAVRLCAHGASVRAPVLAASDASMALAIGARVTHRVKPETAIDDGHGPGRRLFGRDLGRRCAAPSAASPRVP